MIIAIDTETKGLDARPESFVYGCIAKESSKEIKGFTKASDMLTEIIKLGEKEADRGKGLQVYAHNHYYDYLTYAGSFKGPIVRWERPFIAEYKNIKFLDSWGIFRTSLEQVGKLINYPKFDMPDSLLTETEKLDYNVIHNYCSRDAEIVLKAILKIRHRLKELNILPRHLYSIGQASMKCFLKTIKQKHYSRSFFKDFRKSRFPICNKITSYSYRGGRLESFKTGSFNDVIHIDVNSMYPFCSLNIDFPDITTEQYSENTAHNLNKFGCSTVLLKKNDSNIGLIGLRFMDNQVFPKNPCLILGTFTHLEIAEALKNNYELLKVYKSVSYYRTDNPFTDIMNDLYAIRKRSEFDSYLSKSLMNNMIGKLAQKRASFKLKIDSCEKAKEYEQNGWQWIGRLGYNYIYTWKGDETPSKFYAPIIPAYINALARITLFNNLKKVPYNNLIYTDTDSITFQNFIGWKDKFNIGDNIGQFKVKHLNDSSIVYGKKAYSVGSDIKLSGVSKKFLSIDNFAKGDVSFPRMRGLKSGFYAGTFTNETIDLLNTQLMTSKLQEAVDNQHLFIDEKEPELINYLSDVHSYL